MKAWNRLVGYLPASPFARIALAVLGLVVVAAAGVGLARLVSSPEGGATPTAASVGAGPSAVPTASASPRRASTSTATEPAEPRADTTREQDRVLLPFLSRPGEGEPSSTPTPDEPKKPTPTPTPEPVDFEAVRQELAAEGKELAYVKIGFHAGPGGNMRGLGEYLGGLAQVGVPAVVKSADAYGVCLEALQANPENVTVFRMTGGDLELPDYGLDPVTAADQHWARILEALPPEFDQRTWLEVMNEPDKARADWLGAVAERIGELALRDGYRVAAFGWSSGEPEPEHWRLAGMRAYLSLAAEHPDQLAVALHEYSYDVENIANQYPSLVGRFQDLFLACDEMGIARPTVLITEWGWESESVPEVGQAMEDIAWASALYGAYPQVRGAALWYLGPGYGGIANQAQRLIVPMWYYAWGEYFAVEPGQAPRDPAVFAP